MEIKQKYTVSEATQFLGFKSRSTINKRTKANGNNNLTYEIDAQGNKVIALIELERVFPDKYKEALKKNTDTVGVHCAKIQKGTLKNTADTSVLEAKLQMLQEQIEYERSERERERADFQIRAKEAAEREEILRKSNEKLTDTLSKQTLMIEYMRPKVKKNATDGRKGFFARMLG